MNPAVKFLPKGKTGFSGGMIAFFLYETDSLHAQRHAHQGD
jgi:hypothetical protein